MKLSGKSRSKFVANFPCGGAFSHNIALLLPSVQLISGAFEHSMLRVQEIYALDNAVSNIAVYGLYKP